MNLKFCPHPSFSIFLRPWAIAEEAQTELAERFSQKKHQFPINHIAEQEMDVKREVTATIKA